MMKKFFDTIAEKKIEEGIDFGFFKIYRRHKIFLTKFSCTIFLNFRKRNFQ